MDQCVLVTETAPETMLKRLMEGDRTTPPLKVLYRPDLHSAPAALAAAAAGVDALVVRNRTRVDAGLLQTAATLRVVGRLGAGLDNIDVTAAEANNIQVVYAPWGNSVSVAEHTLALLLALARAIPHHDAACHRGDWRRHPLGMELRGRTLGLLGFGTVGRHVAELARGLRMRVITWHPRRPPDHPDLSVTGVEAVTEHTLLRQSDCLSVHLPLTPATRGYLDSERLMQLPRGALLVNTGRGAVIQEDALLRCLKKGYLGGAALDVRRQEPPPTPDPFSRMPNVILTPHMAGLTVAAQERVGRQVATDIQRVLAGLPPLRPVPGTAVSG